MKIRLFLLIALTLPTISLYANNLKITDGTQVSLNQVSFALSWENSWNVGGAPSNHDAIWVFIKYRECGGDGPYIHALLSTTMGDHIFDPRLTYATPIRLEDRRGNVPAGANETNGLGNNTGCMIKRIDIAKGDIGSPAAICTLKVVSSAGDPFLTGVDYEIKVVGIEMVFVRTEPYILGETGGTCSNPFTEYSVNSEDAIPANTILGTQAELPLEYPKGYSGFYCMKYEITEGQFYKFMSTGGNLSGSPSDYYGMNRNLLAVDGTTVPDRAQNYMSWKALLAYLDWAALRPITELEYEKACKGAASFPVEGYAWGSVNYEQIRYVSGVEDGTETAATDDANAHCYVSTDFRYASSPPDGKDNNSVGWQSGCPIWGIATDCTPAKPIYPTNAGNSYIYMWYLPVYMCGSDESQGWGPIGAGIFARDGNLDVGSENRATCGATYYGIMEMSGNVIEQCVDVLSTSYEGTWGNGYIGTGGADVPDWPAATDSRCLRGGGYSLPATNMRVCDRQYNNSTGAADWGPVASAWRKGAIGGRGAR